MAQKLFEVRCNGKRVGEHSYALLSGACLALKEAPPGSEVVEIDGEGNELKRYKFQECQQALTRPIINNRKYQRRD